tara:strand:+ start:231 stop:416 length:186 start_codon:yes stop_codon:yes gene_type:complete
MEITPEQEIIVQKYKEIQKEFKSIKSTMDMLKTRTLELVNELEEMRSMEGELLEKLEKIKK